MAPGTDSTDPAPPATPDDPSTLRASDADRDSIAQLLHHACGAGMLTISETEDRLGAVYAARFRHELLTLTADLPLGRPPLGSHTNSPGDSPLDPVRRFLVSTAPISAAALAALRRHRITLLVLVLLGLILASTIIIAGLDMVLSPEHHPDRMSGR